MINILVRLRIKLKKKIVSERANWWLFLSWFGSEFHMRKKSSICIPYAENVLIKRQIYFLFFLWVCIYRH